MLSIYRAGEIDLFENLEIVHIRLLVVSGPLSERAQAVTGRVLDMSLDVIGPHRERERDKRPCGVGCGEEDVEGYLTHKERCPP